MRAACSLRAVAGPSRCIAAVPAVAAPTPRRSLHSTARRRKTKDDPLRNVQAHSPHFFNSIKGDEGISTLRVLDGEGHVLDETDAGSKEIIDAIDREKAQRMYRAMTLTPIFDKVMVDVQRQGAVGFYMQGIGEEGAVVGSAAAWSDEDMVFAQYREHALFLYRGYSLDEAMAQIFGTRHDTATMGRQMGIHYGSKKHNFQTISSPLATQIPQAAGAAYALKRDASLGGSSDRACICYFGDGAASEGDFHAGMNFAAVLGGPMVFLCRNNGWAISTPVAEQYAGDGIASRGPGYGMQTIRVDGNDALAVYVACTQARRLTLETQKPVLVETMGYRLSHHSTSDDSSAYRSREALEAARKLANPIYRIKQWMILRGWLTEDQDVALQAEHKAAVLKALKTAQREVHPPVASMFDDTWDASSEPATLKEQRGELKRLLTKWGRAYEPWAKALEKYEGQGSEMGVGSKA